MECLLAPIGSALNTSDDIDGVIKWHLDPSKAGIWTNKPRARVYVGMPVITKVSGARAIALTGTVASGPETREIYLDDGRTIDCRYAVTWDQRPPRWIPAGELGPPFSTTVRSLRYIGEEDFQRAYRALHER